MTVFIALLSCSSKTREGRKSERSVSHAKKLQLTAKSKQSPLKRPPKKPPPTSFQARNAVALPKGRGSSTRRFIMSKRSHFYLMAVRIREWRQIGFSCTLQHGADRAVEKDSSKLKCAPTPLLPAGPPHGVHSGMNVPSVRRQREMRRRGCCCESCVHKEP